MGAPRQFPIEYDECVKAIEDYIEKVETGVIKKPSTSDFLGTIGANEDELISVIYEPNDKNIPLSRLLKNFGSWMNGKIIDVYPAPMAKFLLSQGFSGYRYTDKQEVDQSIKAEIKVLFDGVNDPFG